MASPDAVTMVTTHLATQPCSTIVEVYQGILQALLQPYFTLQHCNSSSITTLSLTLKQCDNIQGVVKIFLLNTSLVIHCQIGEELVTYSQDLSTELKLDVVMSLQALRDPGTVINNVQSNVVRVVVLKAKALQGDINLPLLERLPDNVLLQIMGYLPYTELLTVGLVCAKFRDLSLHDPLWRSLYIKEQKLSGKKLTIRSDKTWRHAFIDFKRMELQMENKRRLAGRRASQQRTRYDLDFRYGDII